MVRALVAERADLIAVIEAAYAPEPDDERWGIQLLSATERVLTQPGAMALGVVAHGDGYENRTLVLSATTEPGLQPIFRWMGDEISRASPEAFAGAYYGIRPATTYSEAQRSLSPVSADWLRMMSRTGWDADELVALFAYPAPGIACVLCGGLARRHLLQRHERHVLHRIAGHLDGALRLRLRGEVAVAAVLSPSGALLDTAHPAIAARRSMLSARVVSIEGTRRRAQRRQREALDAWQGLIEGRFTVVPREDRDGKRYYLLVSNPPIARENATFTARESSVLRLSARGFAGKEVAYALGISPSGVSQALADAAARVGLRSRDALVRVGAALFAGPKRQLDGIALTRAERELLDLLSRGLTNAEIASLRKRSPRTVANQMASLLRKTGAPNRRSLGAMSFPDPSA